MTRTFAPTSGSPDASVKVPVMTPPFIILSVTVSPSRTRLREGECGVSGSAT